MANRVKRDILRAYTTPGHPVAYSTPSRVAKHFHVSEKVAKEILEENDGYTLHREYKSPRHYNPYYVHSRREQVQADLIDIAKIKNNNRGVRFLLLLIDIFTKYMWVITLKSKAGGELQLKLRHWLANLDEKPKNMLTDRGNEFTNAGVQTLLRQNNVTWHPALGTLKAAIAERANKTLQILIYKYLTDNETLTYVNVLPDLVRTYNNRAHRTLKGMTPAQADQVENEQQVQEIFHEKYYKIGLLRKDNLPLKVGDMVRIKTEPKKISSSSRAYAEQFHGPFYKITRINRTLPIALYYLRDFDSGEHIQGGFYKEELQRQRGDVYKIEAILDRRTRRGRREILVKWKWFSDQWNEWIPERNVRRVF